MIIKSKNIEGDIYGQLSRINLVTGIYFHHPWFGYTGGVIQSGRFGNLKKTRTYPRG